MDVEFANEAIEESREAYDFYVKRSETAAAGFEQSLRDAVSHLLQFPGIGAPGPAGTRHLLLRRYPYLVHYRVKGETVRILAVAHAKRRPGFWLRRR